MQLADSLNYDPSRGLLYISDQTGVLHRFDLQSQTFLPDWNIGFDLGAADLTPDLKYLYITQLEPNGPDALLYKVDLDTGAVSTLVILPNSQGAGVYDVEIASNGIAFLTMTSLTPRTFPLYQLDTATDTVSIRADAPGSVGNGMVNRYSYLNHSIDKSHLAISDPLSPNGRLILYDAATDTFSAQTDTGPSQLLQDEISRDNTLVASSGLGRYVNIYDSNFQFVTNLAPLGADGSVLFDSKRDILYAVNSVTNEILGIDTHTWTKLFSIPMEFDASVYPELYGFEDAMYIYYTSADTGPVSEYTLPSLVSIENPNGRTNPAANATILAASLAEGNSGTKSATVTVSLSVPNPQTVTLHYATVDGSAVAGSDYQATSGTLTFLPNQITQTISIPILGDTVVEPDETFGVVLSDAVNAYLFQSQAVVVIRNDDSGAPPSLTNVSTQVTFPENLVNAVPQIIDSDVTFTDPDTPVQNGGSLVATMTSGGGPEDVLGIQNTGGPGQIATNGSTVTYGGVPFGNFAFANGTLTVLFNTDAATPAVIEALIETLTYQNTSDTPAASRDVTLVVNDPFGTSTVPAVVTINVTPENDPPVVSPIANQSILEDSAITVSFTVDDDETLPAALIVTATSSNHTLLPDASAVPGGSGQNRTLTLTPLPNRSGVTTIQVTVSDGALQTVRLFTLTVVAVDDPPTISPIADLIIDEDTSTGPLSFTIDDIDTPLASLVVTATSSDTTLVPQSRITLGGSGGSRTITATPAANQFGTTTITLSVKDGTTTRTEPFVLTVNPVPDAPTISHIADRNTNESTPTPTLSFTVGDVDTPLASLTVTANSSDTTLVPIGNIVLGGSGANRTVVITPTANLSGPVIITLTVSDGALTAQDSFTLNVLPVDSPPTISHINSQTILEDTPSNPLAFTVNDSDTPLANLIVTATSSNPAVIPNANLQLSGSGMNRTLVATPLANKSGVTQITMSVFDGTTTVTDTFQITVVPVNDPPAISDLGDQTINEDQSTGILNFTISDLETAATDLVVTATSSNLALVANANLVLGGTGGNRTLVVTPLADQSGTAIITVTVSDGQATVSDTFNLTVLPVNDPPNVSAIAQQNINEDTSTGALPFVIGDVDSPLASLTVSATSSDTTLILNANLVLGGSGANRTITVTPAANLSGTATITLTVSDGTASRTTTFDVVVAPVNDPPTISNIPDQQTNEDVPLAGLSFTVNDIDNPANTLVVSATSSNSALVSNSNILFGGSNSARTLSVVPLLNQSGTTTITVTVSDGTATATETFVLTVVPVNDAPQISNPGNASILEDTNLTGMVSVNDVETDPADLILTATSSNPSLVPDGNIQLGGSGTDRTFSITPAANQAGVTQITLTVSDGDKQSSVTFQLTVTEVNDVPSISSIPLQTILEDFSTGVLPFTVSDPETPAASLVVTASSSNQAVLPDGNIVLGGTTSERTISATPLPDQSGLTVITIQVSDGLLTKTSSLVVVVTAVNDAPTLILGPAPVIDEDAPAVQGQQWATGISTGPANEAGQQLTITVEADHPELFSVQPSLLPDGTLSYTVAPNAFGQTTVTVTIKDDGGTANSGVDTLTQSLIFTINAVDDPLEFVNSEAVRQYVRTRPGFPIDPQLGVRDIDTPDIDFSNGQLVVTGGTRKDLVSLPKRTKHKVPPGGVGRFKKTHVMFHDQEIATLQGGKKGIALTLQFGEGVTEEAINALVKAIIIKAKGKHASGSTRELHYDVADASGSEQAEGTHTLRF